MDLTRRQTLVALGAVGVGAVLFGDDDETGGVALPSDSPRTERLRPMAGGTWITPQNLDGFGTLGVGVDDDGTPSAVTNRHVVDEDSNEQPSEIEGRAVYQPESDDLLGWVSAASKRGGAGSSDWAVIELAVPHHYTNHTLGFGEVGEPTTPSEGERVVLDGAPTGLLGGFVERTDVSTNWRGELYDGLIEFTVDENTATSGASGSVLATWDGSDWRPVGLHAFALDTLRYAIPWSDLPASVDVTVSGDEPSPPHAGGVVDGTLVSRSGTTVTAWIANTGGETTESAVELRTDDGDTLDSTETTLGALEQTTISLDAGETETLRLVAGETDRVTNWGYEPE